MHDLINLNVLGNCESGLNVSLEDRRDYDKSAPGKTAIASVRDGPFLSGFGRIGQEPARGTLNRAGVERVNRRKRCTLRYVFLSVSRVFLSCQLCAAYPVVRILPSLTRFKSALLAFSDGEIAFNATWVPERPEESENLQEKSREFRGKGVALACRLRPGGIKWT